MVESVPQRRDLLAGRLGALLVVESLNHGDQVGKRLFEHAAHHESGPSHHHDVRSAIGQFLVEPHFGDTADSSRAGWLGSARLAGVIPNRRSAARQSASIRR